MVSEYIVFFERKLDWAKEMWANCIEFMKIAPQIKIPRIRSFFRNQMKKIMGR
jgi:hypothetical protein